MGREPLQDFEQYLRSAKLRWVGEMRRPQVWQYLGAGVEGWFVGFMVGLDFKT